MMYVVFQKASERNSAFRNWKINGLVSVQIQGFRVSEKFVQGWKISICSYLPANEHIPFQGTFESIIFLCPRWDMLVPWRVYKSQKNNIFPVLNWKCWFAVGPPKKKALHVGVSRCVLVTGWWIIDILHQTSHRSRFLKNMHQVCISSLVGGGFKDVYFSKPCSGEDFQFNCSTFSVSQNQQNVTHLFAFWWPDSERHQLKIYTDSSANYIFILDGSNNANVR